MNFIDLKEQYRRYKKEIHAEIEKVMESAQFIMGPILTEFENELASYTGVNHAIGCSSGTDALLLSLMVKKIKINLRIGLSAYPLVKIFQRT